MCTFCDHENGFHSDEDSEIIQFANSSEDDPEYAPINIDTDSDVEAAWKNFSLARKVTIQIAKF